MQKACFVKMATVAHEETKKKKNCTSHMNCGEYECLSIVWESICISTTQIQKCFAHLNNGKMKMATPASNICYIIRQKENSNINCAVRILPTKRFYCVAKFGDSILCDNGWFAATTLFISLALSLFLPFYQVFSVMLSLSRLMFNPLYVVPILYVSKIVLLSFYMLWI